MKVMAIGTLKPFSHEQKQRYLPKEVPATLQLYLDGKMEQFWLRDKEAGVIFLMNVDSVDDGPERDLHSGSFGGAVPNPLKVLADLLSDKVSGPSLSLITQLLTHPRGRSPQAALDVAAGIAARRRQQLIAVVRAATDLSTAQRRRLLDTLTAAYGQGIHLNVVHDPAVIGGISVQIGDELVDGTASSRLAAVRRKLAG